MDILEFLHNSTPLDLLVIILTILLVIVGAVLLLVVRSRTPFFVYMGLGLMLLLLGLLATYLKYGEAERMMSLLEPGTALELREAVRREAWIISYIAGVGAIIVWLIGLIGVGTKRRKPVTP